jgi:hypothetical protein
MSDATTDLYPVMDSHSPSDNEKAASPDAKPKGIVMTWQLKALLAGRTPLRSERPKRRFNEMTPESSVSPDSSALEEGTENVKRMDDSYSKDDKDDTIISHVVSIISVDINTSSGWTLTSHRLKEQN